MHVRALVLAAALGVAAVHPSARASAQLPEDSVPEARGGSEFWIPFGSVFVPGLGQYLQGAPLAGLGYSGTFLAGLLVSSQAGGSTSLARVPRSGRDQLSVEALHVAFTAGLLSAHDAFYRPMSALRAAGKYDFLTAEEDLGDLLWAPLDYRFLGRWTTWVDIAFIGGVLAWALSEDDRTGTTPPFDAGDAAFAASLSLNAAVGEEAAFRGWLLPMLTQKLGGRFWIANGIQAWLFGSAHATQAGAFAWVIAADALYSGWVTRRNGWSVREVVFHHFWYDAAIATAALLTDDDATVTFIPVQIRF
jgi:membrane protease YdiL (CAAX protease family)